MPLLLLLAAVISDACAIFGFLMDLAGRILIDSVLWLRRQNLQVYFALMILFWRARQLAKSKVLFGRNEACCQITSVLPHFF